MAFKTDERYKISKCYDHELLHRADGHGIDEHGAE